MYKFTKTIIFFSFFCFSLFAYSYSNRPQIRNLNRTDYKADNKNWAISQDSMGIVYFGNDIGLLQFDGIEWKLNTLPKAQVVRSVSAISENTILTGGFEEFGRWDKNISGELQYTSISQDIDNNLLKNGDFWKIIQKDSLVYFQSFNSIFLYDYKEVKRIPLPSACLFLTKVRDNLVIQGIRGPLYKIEQDSIFTKIPGSDIFSDTDVRVILPFKNNQCIIGTSTKGFFLYDGTKFTEWNSLLSKEMKLYELNCGILSSRNTYYFGTILNGIYEVDIKGNIINHISTKQGLQNNTILSLYESYVGDLWVALDRGIAHIDYEPDVSFYTDPLGNIGAVYSAVEWQNNLVIGTNQGVFYAPISELSSKGLSSLKFLPDSQGQVWALKIMDGRLFCAHNQYLREIGTNLRFTNTYYWSGVYNMTQEESHGSNILYLSTYNSISTLNYKTGQAQEVAGISEPIKDVETDHLGNLWLEHANRGVYRTKLSDDKKRFTSQTYYGGNSNDGLPYKLKLFKLGGRVEMMGDSRFFTYDEINDKIIENKVLNNCFEHLSDLILVKNISKNTYWLIGKRSIHKFFYDGYTAHIIEGHSINENTLSLVNFFENISILNDSISLVCLDNGFILYNSELAQKEKNKLSSPYFQHWGIRNNKEDFTYHAISGENIKIPYDQNTLKIDFFSKNIFSSDLAFQYKLKGLEESWSTPQKISSMTYPRLSAGHYQFQLRTISGIGETSDIITLNIEVLPPWYTTPWAYIIYILLTGAILSLIWLLILRRYRNIHLRKIRHRETLRLRSLANQLQDEVEAKNAEMLTQASFIIQKNELLQTIKKVVDDFYKSNAVKSLIPLQQKITALLNQNINSDDDWKMFLIKFEEKHTGFFTKLKSLYPDLTTNDLRLCACLKLNLDTKDIASLMNLSIRAVENNRYRLRKKLELDSNQNLNEFILEIK